MNQRFLMWGLTSIAFVVTLAISSWHEGLWQSEPVTARGNRQPAAVVAAAMASTEPTPMPLRPFAPEHAAAAIAPPPSDLAATKPETQTPPQQPTSTDAEVPVPPMPVAEAEVDTTEFLAHRDRASQHSSRAR